MSPALRLPWITVYISIFLIGISQVFLDDGGDGNILILLFFIITLIINAITGLVSSIRNYKNIYIVPIIYHFLSFIFLLSGSLGG